MGLTPLVARVGEVRRRLTIYRVCLSGVFVEPCYSR